jgi:hypothetical protein
MMNGLPVTANSTVGESSCNGGACSKFGSAEEAAAMMKVLGDRSMRTCANASECTSGDADDQPGTTVAGTGFAHCWKRQPKPTLSSWSGSSTVQKSPRPRIWRS